MIKKYKIYSSDSKRLLLVIAYQLFFVQIQTIIWDNVFWITIETLLSTEEQLIGHNF